MALHCLSNSSIWSNEFFCSKDRGYCETNNFVVPTCICNKGFRHDTTMGRYRDCRVPMAYYPVVDGLSIAISILLFIFTLSRFKHSKSLARMILIGCIFSEVFTAILAAVRFADDHIETGRSLFLYGVNFTLVAFISYLMTYSLAMPLHSLSKVPIEVFGRQLKILFLVFRIILFTPIFIAIAKFEDYNNQLLDYGWNFCVVLISLTCSLEMVFLTLNNVYNSYKMIRIFKELNDALSLKHGTRKQGVDDYINRIQGAVFTQLCVSPFILLVASVVPVVHFATNYFPYIFILLGIINLAFPATAFMGTRYAATSQKPSFESSSEPKQQQVAVQSNVKDSLSGNQDVT